MVKTLAEYETGEKGSGDPSRWDANRELEWYELRPELVVEVTYDHTPAAASATAPRSSAGGTTRTRRTARSISSPSSRRRRQ